MRGLESGEREKGKREEGSREREREEFQERMREGGNKKYVESDKGEMEREVQLDVVPLDICGIVLGSHYLYERKAIFFKEENKYHLTKDGVEYIVREHSMKTKLSLVSARKMKRLINARKKFLLIVVKANMLNNVLILRVVILLIRIN